MRKLILLAALAVVAAGGADAAKKKKETAKPKPKLSIEDQEKALGATDESATRVRVLVAPDDPTMGRDDALVTVIAFADATSVDDRRVLQDLLKLANDVAEVRVVFKQYSARNATEPLIAALAAGEQGKFVEFLAVLLANKPEEFKLETYRKWAGSLGLDADKLQAAIESGRGAAKV
jgi:protein-disulfide isomerase